MLRYEYDSDDSYITSYSEEENRKKFAQLKKEQLQRRENLRTKRFDDIFSSREGTIFELVGLNITKFTSKKIKFTYQPSLIYEHISTCYLHYCSLKYLERYKKWIVKREPLPAFPLYDKVPESIFFDDNIEVIFNVINKIYQHLNKVSEDEIMFRKHKYEKYKKGKLSYFVMDSIDEELYLTHNEREQIRKKKETVSKRMEWPKVATERPIRKAAAKSKRHNPYLNITLTRRKIEKKCRPYF